MCTINEGASLNKAYNKYRKGKKVEEGDVWALRRLNESNYIVFYRKEDGLYAADPTKAPQ